MREILYKTSKTVATGGLRCLDQSADAVDLSLSLPLALHSLKQSKSLLLDVNLNKTTRASYNNKTVSCFKLRVKK